MKKRIIVRRRAAPADNNITNTGIKVLDNQTFDSYNPSLLGLGDINARAAEVEAVAAIFDLSGFTRFSNQVDPQLTIPQFLNYFLSWLFDSVKNGLMTNSFADHKELWADLPFLTKFLGDGVLFLWDTKGMAESRICDIVSVLHDICYGYRYQFYPWISKEIAHPPNILRCGIGRGKVFSVGNGRDYIGHSINIASRLQKLSLLTFCFPRRGFDVKNQMRGSLREKVIQKRVNFRGFLETDLIWVLKDEFAGLPDKEKVYFKQP